MKASTWLPLLVAAACAGSAPSPGEFDSSAGLVVVDVDGDGFVRCGERRVPMEAIVLELRQRVRGMSDDELQRFVVHLRADPQAKGSEAAARCQATMNRLVDELVIMGVRQVKFL
jgi:hypothetical protein